MRVIAGSARSLKLVTAGSMDTRPTTDRIKETLFNMLSNDIPGCRFLDVFSGSGAIGIEALSRGADMAVFVGEQQKEQGSVSSQKPCLQSLPTRGAGIVSGCCSGSGDVGILGRRRFSVIFMDPPYGKLLEKAVLGKACRFHL